MPNQPPLNPDALRVATAAAHDAVDWQMYDVTKFDLEDSVDVATIAAVSAYLAVVQPVVNSVEELDQLPIGSAIIDKYGDLGLIDRDGTIEKCVQFAETIAMSIGYTAKHFLPAHVLYRPEVKP